MSHMKYKAKKSYESRKYSVPHNVRIGTGALGNTTDKLKTRKPEGYIKSKPIVPHTRGE